MSLDCPSSGLDILHTLHKLLLNVQARDHGRRLEAEAISTNGGYFPVLVVERGSGSTYPLGNLVGKVFGQCMNEIVSYFAATRGSW